MKSWIKNKVKNVKKPLNSIKIKQIQQFKVLTLTDLVLTSPNVAVSLAFTYVDRRAEKRITGGRGVSITADFTSK